jgi:hypothetical protein
MSELVAVCLWCKSRNIILSQPALVPVRAGYNFGPVYFYAMPQIFFNTPQEQVTFCARYDFGPVYLYAVPQIMLWMVRMSMLVIFSV